MLCRSSCELCEGSGVVIYLCSKCLGTDFECKECSGKGAIQKRCPNRVTLFDTPTEVFHDNDFLNFDITRS